MIDDSEHPFLLIFIARPHCSQCTPLS